MKDWKNIKDKEIILGLIVIIILGAIALTLLIRREIRYRDNNKYMVAEESYEETVEAYNEDETEETEEIFEETDELSDDIEVKENEEIEESLANVQIITEENSKDIAKKSNEEVALYDILGEEKYKAATLTERKQEDNQLKELYEYWDAYKLDAVADLVRLERLQKISKELKGKDKFYYYGSLDRLGRPSGKGLAVYGDNTYYFGEWKEGLRHGKGMWLEVAIYTEGNQDENLGVIEHSYNGEWSKDLPNGQGQEHFSYDYEILKEDFIEGKCISNVIGGFKDGYYHGEMYIMTVDEKGNSTEWNANCDNGAWEVIQKGQTSDSVWESYEADEKGNYQYHYWPSKDNRNCGIMGLKKPNTK